MILLGDRAIVPTIFPDKTSQVWKIEPSLLKHSRIVQWKYESESELIHLCQLLSLLKEYNKDFDGVKLFIPYLPYARQDKEISNDLTFALHTTMNILTRFIKAEQIVVFDVHNWLYEHKNLQPNKIIEHVLLKYKYDVMVYPDKSASERYDIDGYDTTDHIVMSKVRDQSTGRITNHRIEESYITIDKDIKSMILLDDLCDRGGTFISCAKALKEKYPDVQLDLYISHGIFSGGLEELSLYFNKIFTTDSYIRNFQMIPNPLKIYKIEDYYHI